jgi:putative NADH-flavin reductase
MVGSRFVDEAWSRGHRVTAYSRSRNRTGLLEGRVERRVADAMKQGDVEAAVADHDVVIASTRPAPGAEGQLTAVTRVLLDVTATMSTRLLVVGGSASLKVPGTGRLVLEDTDYVPLEWRPIAQASFDQFVLCDSHRSQHWTYLSPPAILEPGPRTGRYRVGADELLLDANGLSWISAEDLVTALADEIAEPAHVGARFTVAHHSES